MSLTSGLDGEGGADVPFLSVICVTCGRDNPNHLLFCQECGQKLAPRVAPPTPPVGLVPAFVPRPSSPSAPAPAGGTAPMGTPAARDVSHLATTQAATPFGATAFADPGPAAFAPSARPSAPDFAFAPRQGHPQGQATAAAPLGAAKLQCPRCSAWNDVGLRFCVSCGGSLDARTAPIPAAGAPNAHAPLGSAPLTHAPIANAPMTNASSAIASLANAPLANAPTDAVIAPARVVSLAAPQAPATVRVCARCRGACDATAQFCRFCGASLAESPPIPSSALPSSASSAPVTPIEAPIHTSANGAGYAPPSTANAPTTDPIPPPLSSSVISSIEREARPRMDTSIDGEPDSERPSDVQGLPIPHISTRPEAPTDVSLGSARLSAMSATSLHGGQSPVISVGDEPLPKARLVVIAKDGGEGPSYPIGESMDIGRTDGHITIPEDRYLSPRHVRIARVANPLSSSGSSAKRLVLRDLDSTNGVYVRLRHAASGSPEARINGPDGAPTHLLNDQDLFLVGQQVLRFEIVSDAIGEAGLGPASQHGTLLFGTPAAPRYARLSQRTVEGVSRDVFYIRKAETVLGRESGDIVFTEDPFLSRRHAAVRMEGTSQDGRRRFLLADLGSSNGTFVQIRGEVVLQSGDQFRIGQQLFRIDVA